MEKKPHLNIGYIGHVDHGRSLLNLERTMIEHKAIIVLSPEPHYDIEINGVKYVEVHQSSSRYQRGSMISMAYIMAAGLAASITGSGTGGGYRERPDVNIVSEFQLIQDKKSTLSRNDRDWVVSQFNKFYKALGE